jgi:GxxExxY protein
LAIDVHRATGPSLLEFAYAEILCDELEEAGLPLEREVMIPVRTNPRRFAINRE